MRNRILLSAATSLFAFSLLWGTAGSLDTASWTFTPIDYPGADQSDARDMNESGQIVGSYYIVAQDEFRGFLLSNRNFTPIWIGDYSDARGISPEGEIVGSFASSVDGYVTHGYLLQHGDIKQIDWLDAYYTVPEAINAAGDVVGFYGMEDTEHGFLLRRGVLSPIDYPGATLTNARGINAEGEIVGIYTNNPTLGGPYHGFLRKKDGTFITVNGPGVPGGNANGINTRGEIVGEYSVSGGHFGFLLSQGRYAMINYPGATITRAWKITEDGQHIVGLYDDQHGFVLSRKPLK